MKNKLLRAAALAAALVVLCAGVCALLGPAAPDYSTALAAARQYLADTEPQGLFYPDGSFYPLADGLCRLGFVDSTGRPLSLTLWRDPLHRYRVCGAVYARP